MAERISARIDDMRTQVAQSMFAATQEEVETAEQTDELEVNEAYVNQAGTGHSKEGYHDAGLFDKKTAEKHAKTHGGVVIKDPSGDHVVKIKKDKSSAVKEQQETFVEEDFQWITEEEYLQLTKEEQEEYLTEEQLDELMGKGSIGAIRDIHHDAAYKAGKQTDRTKFHGTQAARAGHIASKISTRAKYGKDAQHYHEYGYNSKKAKGSYARLSPDAKKKVTKTLGKEYTGKDKSPNTPTKGKTTIDNPHTKSQQHDLATDRTKTRAEYGLKQLPQDKETISKGRD
jgi:hypothetical protein